MIFYLVFYSSTRLILKSANSQEMFYPKELTVKTKFNSKEWLSKHSQRYKSWKSKICIIFHFTSNLTTHISDTSCCTYILLDLTHLVITDTLHIPDSFCCTWHLLLYLTSLDPPDTSCSMWMFAVPDPSCWSWYLLLYLTTLTVLESSCCTWDTSCSTWNNLLYMTSLSVI